GRVAKKVISYRAERVAIVSTDQSVVAALRIICDRVHIADEYVVVIIDAGQRLVIGMLLVREDWIKEGISVDRAHGQSPKASYRAAVFKPRRPLYAGATSWSDAVQANTKSLSVSVPVKPTSVTVSIAEAVVLMTVSDPLGVMTRSPKCATCFIWNSILS